MTPPATTPAVPLSPASPGGSPCSHPERTPCTVHLVHLDAAPDEVLEALLLAVRQAPAPLAPRLAPPRRRPLERRGWWWRARGPPHVPNGAGWPRPGGTAPGGADARPAGGPAGTQPGPSP